MEDSDDDPFMHGVRDAVLAAGAAFAPLLPESISDPEMRRIVRFEVRTAAPRRLRAHVGSELWELLSLYYMRRVKEANRDDRRVSILAMLALLLEELIAIDNIDPADVYDDYYDSL